MKQSQAWRKVPEILDDSPAIDSRTGFKHQHGQASFQGLFCDQATNHPGSHDDDVCIVIACHLDNSSFESTAFKIQACC
jgi:hypothetical protein